MLISRGPGVHGQKPSVMNFFLYFSPQPIWLLCEHPHTYTAGRRVQFTQEEERRLRRTGADVVEVGTRRYF